MLTHQIKAALFIVIICFLGTGCEFKTNSGKSSANSEKKVRNGLIKARRSDGSLKSAANYKDGELHGVSTNYYKSGQVRSTLTYNMGVKDGLTTIYFESGKKSRETSYTLGEKNGVEKIYRENGLLSAEVPYKNGNPGVGLKEYLKDGKPKTKFPELIIKVEDRIKQNGSYTIKVYFERNAKRAEYFVGELEDGQFLNGPLAHVPTFNGVGEIKFALSPGEYIMEKLNIVGNLKTARGNPYIVQKTFNLAIENTRW